MEKYCTAGQVTDDNMGHAHCMRYAYGYKHTLIILVCNTHCFSTAKIVARMPLNVTLNVVYIVCLVTYLLPVCAVFRSITPSVLRTSTLSYTVDESLVSSWLVQHRQFSVNGALSE